MATTGWPVRRWARLPRLRDTARLAVWGLALLVPVGCDLTSVEEIAPEDVMVVEAYLRPALVQEVYLHRTLPGRDGTLEVPGATVVIEGPDATIALVASQSGCVNAGYGSSLLGTCYSTPSGGFGVSPGATYRLRVATDDGRELTGTTTVPSSFEIRSPAVDSCSLGAGLLEIAWSPSEGAWSYQAVARLTGLREGFLALGVADPPDELELTGLAIGRSDTTIVFPREFGVFDRFNLDRDVALALQQGLPAGASADIVVAAGDANFVNWVRGGDFNPSGQVRVPSITGDGTGVFGSLVTQRVTVLGQTPGYPACP